MAGTVFTVSNLTVTTDGALADGIATAALTNTRAGVSKVTASVNGNSQYVNVTFVADGNNLSTTNSTLGASPSTIIADGVTASTITLTLLNNNGNPVSGQAVTFASSLADSSVGTVIDNRDGTYTAPLTGTAPGSTSITALIDGSPFGVAPASVTLNALTDVLVNSTNFGLNDGFPTTGFIGAVFTLNVTGSPTDYNWASSDTSWVSVDSSGKVSFTAEGNSTPVTITASLKTGGGNLTYTFTVTSWFINNGLDEGGLVLSEALTFCTDKGMLLPIRSQLVNVSTAGTNGTREAGNNMLWSEWGNLNINAYPLAGFVSSFYWTSELESSGRQYIVRLDNGLLSTRATAASSPVVCRKAL